ncbi:hypothetical protein [Streptomyces sp. ODS05-4]|uniref:hypothetical protein n=1 Tax=Streptomyces sp. ODS05-4 TaxID=2944939 RepID=UPI00210EA5A6|nr:hypothetical protein [Streptomyces sp. ODS05-4]
MSAPSGYAPTAGPRLLRAAVFAAACVALSGLGHALAACAGVPWWTLVVGFLTVFGATVPFTGRDRSLPVIAAALAGGQLGLHVLFSLGQRHQHLLYALSGGTVGSGAGTGGPVSGQADDALIRIAAQLVCGGSPRSLSTADAYRIVAGAGLDPHTAAASASASGGYGAHAAHAAAPEALLPGLPMVLAHLLAALATGWLLRRGDLALLRLARLSTRGAGEVADGALVRALRAALVLVQALAAGLPVPAVAGRRTVRPGDDAPPPVSADALQHSVIRRGPPAVLVLAA